MSEQNNPTENEHELGYQVIISCVILVFYVIAAHVIERKKITFLHESSLSILFGLLIAMILDQAVNVRVDFNEKLFFSVILPPIIFSAGYTLRKKYFIQNFGMIQFYGIIGTVMAFVVISSFAILFNEWNMFGTKLDISDLLLLSSVLCATDTVAVLNLVKEAEFPILNSILFGEGIMNDAISIVIFRSIKNFLIEANSDFGTKAVFSIMGYFVYLLFMSILVGLFFGLTISYFFKKFDSYNQFPVRETALIYLISYITYLLSEIFGYSGIISLFVCGVVMGQYTYHNISPTSQRGTVLVFESIAYVAEAFVFCYLGMSLYNMNMSQIPFLFSFLMIGVIFLARFFAIFTLPCIKFLCRSEQVLKMTELKVVWYSGLIRGAIAFAMVLQIKSDNSQLLINTVMVIVVFTIVILSSLLQVFSRYVGLQRSDEEEMMEKICINDNEASEFSNFGSIGKYPGISSSSADQQGQQGNGRISKKIHDKLTSLEERFIRPVFVKEESQGIKEINLTDLDSSHRNSTHEDNCRKRENQHL